MRRAWRMMLGLAALSGAAVLESEAQGTLSTQGLGFPPGQLSAKAAAMGGSIGEGDALSPLNPAAISFLLTPVLAIQAEPEYRELRYGAKKQKTAVTRFPLFLASMPLGSRWGAMLSASTLFDRTWGTTARDTQVVGTDTIGASVLQVSEGSVMDLRLGASYMVVTWLRVGFGLHAYSGGDNLRTVRVFDDTVRFAGDTQQTTLSFGGTAVSVGAQTLWPGKGAVGVSYRRGGAFRTYLSSTTTDVAAVPDHFGVSAVYLGIEGTTLAARVATDQWTRLRGISPSLRVHEGWDIGLGADVLGPRFGGGAMAVRAGVRWRPLPFSADGTPVKERTISAGLGFPLGRQRAELNVGVLRAVRSGPIAADERAWTISTGYTVRP